MKDEKQLLIISISVVLMHTVGIAWCGWSSEDDTIRSMDKLVVKTVNLEKKKEVAQAKPKPKPKPKVKTKPKPQVKAKPKPKVEKNTEKVAKNVEVDHKKQKLLAAAQEMIAKFQKPEDNLHLEVPDTIDTLAVDSIKPLNDIRYQEILVTRMKKALRLPEYGEVKIKLTLDSSGKVLKIDYVSAQSTVNRDYIDKTLPKVNFPSFGTFMNGAQHTFSITLKNDT